MTFDQKAPANLKKTQQWFGSIIGRPIDEESRMNPVSPSGFPMEEEAVDFIAPSPTLRPAQRIEIYNQQYWWRLLNALHETFPLVTRLFGYHDFNRSIAVPYLVKYPPQHWSLAILGKRLPQWIEEDYDASDKPLVLDSAIIDYYYTHSFMAKQRQPISMANLPVEGDPESLLNHTLYLQDHIRLFEMNYDLFDFRFEFLKKDPEYWIDNDFPPLKKGKCYHFILYRTQRNDIAWKEISIEEYQLLKQFEAGTTIDAACEWLEHQNKSIFDEAMKNLHRWFQEWIVLRWLTLEGADQEGGEQKS